MPDSIETDQGYKQAMKKILIVDDDHRVVKSLSALLEGDGYWTCGITSGKAAIEKVKSEDFDLVLLDIVMPRISGIDTLTELKCLNPKMPVIMVSAFPGVEGAVEAIKKGACDYVSKPFKHEELLSKIGRAIEKAKFEEYLNEFNIDNILHTLANPVRRDILKLLSLRISTRMTEIARRLDVDDHSKIVFHLKLLMEEGIIEQDNEKTYALTPEGEKILGCLKFIEDYLSK